MRIIPPRRKQAPGHAGEAEEVVANPARLARKALVMDSDYEEAADPAVRRAERALDQVRLRYRDSIAEAVTALVTLYRQWERPGSGRAAREALYRAAHDLRGMAADLGSPLVGRIATSLSRLLGFVAAPGAELVRAHVDALRAAARPGIDPEDAVALAVAEELEGRVADAITREGGGA